MAGYDGAGSIFALGARFTKLDSAGAPLAGARNSYTTEALISVNLGHTYSEPDAIELKNGQGATCVYYAPKPTLLSGTIEDLKFCTPDPYVLQFLQGGDVIATGGVNEVQTVTITGTPTGGSFTLTFNGQTTAAITYNAAASAVQSALIALSNLTTGDVTVTGSTGGPYTVTFGGVYASVDVPALSASGTGLTGGTNPGVTVTITTPGAPGQNATGYRAPLVNVESTPNGVGIELWSKAVLDNSLLAGGIQWVLPRAKLTPSDALALGAEDPTQPSFAGTLEQNPNFGAGPLGDITFPTDRIYQFNRVNTLPALSTGLVTVSPEA